MDDEDSEQFQSADEGVDLVEECGATYPSSGVIEHGEKPRRKSPYSEITEITQPTSPLKLNSEYPLTPVIQDVARREPELKTLPPKVENKERRKLKDDGSAGKSVFDALESKPIPSVKTPPVSSSGDLISERVESKSVPPRVERKDKRKRKNRSPVGKFESDAVESEPTFKVEPILVTSVADDLTIRDPHSKSVSPRVEKRDGTRQKDRIGVRQSESDAVESISIASVKSLTVSPASSDLMSKEQMSKASPPGVESEKEGLKVDNGITEFEPVDVCLMEVPDAEQELADSVKKKALLDHSIEELAIAEQNENFETVGFTPPSPRPQLPDPARSQSSAFWDWSGVSSLAQQLTSSFQTKGLNLVHEGVNVLEKIGKKTMSVIEENDPGFQYTKTLFRPPGLQERPTLSEIIREAHERHQNERNSETPSNESNRGSFTAQLESRRALVHLEALELVSDKAQSQLHIQLDTFLSASVVHEELNLDSGILEAIWKTLQLDIDDDENVNAGFPDQSTWKILKCKKRQPGSYGAYPTDLSEENSSLWVAFERSLSLIKTIYPGEKLLHSVTNVWNEMKKVEASISAEEIYFIAIGALAEVTSAYLEYLHKFSECTLVRTHKPTADFERLTSIVAVMFRAAMKLIDALCSEYTGIIKSAHKIEGDGKPVKSVSQLAGSLLLECGNAQAYLQNTAHLLVPILQLACVNTKRAAGETE
ncbi:hypothetical protein FGIG_04662 [Fasciola gigantica]|uniref:Protein FAM114A2 n=1 Tax=Fasciola gigantica TaxID=46835 RepID=A0A504YG64_FASGI|nr:hypothetical protein FGIG_04662 [Fasciola gigantica]